MEADAHPENTVLKHLMQAHCFFCRQSQHYVLGNWWKYETNYLGWPTTKAWRFALRFPIAYVKFMSFAVYDGIRGYRYGPY